MGKGTWTLVVLLISTQGAEAQDSSPIEPAGAPPPAVAVRTLADIAIDGLDSDAIWRTAPVVDGFRQFDPELDADPSHPTEFRVAYDADDLYVFVRAYDV